MKPFDSKEMVARVKAVLRRSIAPAVSETSDDSLPKECVTYPDLVINQTDYSVTYKNKRIEMPPKELELLYFLASHPNQVFTREQLLDHIWSYDYIEIPALSMSISNDFVKNLKLIRSSHPSGN